jgi:DNA-binding transcriptional regulator YdaS (Cro superfamily)
MDLHAYCEKNGGTGLRGCPVLAQLAATAGYSAETLYMIAKGHKKAGALMASSLDAATNGAVSRHDLRPDVFGAAQAGQGEAA